jgi:hypothetical protein
MISDKVHKLCNGTETVSSEMAKDPTLAPGEVYKKLYGHFDSDKSTAKERDHKEEISEADLKRAEECGNWGPTKPSELFLRVCTAPWGRHTESIPLSDVSRCALYPGQDGGRGGYQSATDGQVLIPSHE